MAHINIVLDYHRSLYMGYSVINILLLNLTSLAILLAAGMYKNCTNLTCSFPSATAICHPKFISFIIIWADKEVPNTNVCVNFVKIHGWKVNIFSRFIEAAPVKTLGCKTAHQPSCHWLLSMRFRQTLGQVKSILGTK